jgi:hypothetical protein
MFHQTGSQNKQFGTDFAALEPNEDRYSLNQKLLTPGDKHGNAV